MPRYFFHVHDGTDVRDRVGVGLPDAEAARSQAIQACGEMLRDIDGELRPDVVWEMNVENEAGESLFTFRFMSEDHRRSSLETKPR